MGGDDADETARPRGPRPGRPRRTDGTERGAEYEYRTVTIPYGTSASAAHRLLTDAAEYDRWELARTTLYVGGRREVLLRRRIIRVRATLRATL